MLKKEILINYIIFKKLRKLTNNYFKPVWIIFLLSFFITILDILGISLIIKLIEFIPLLSDGINLKIANLNASFKSLICVFFFLMILRSLFQKFLKVQIIKTNNLINLRLTEKFIKTLNLINFRKKNKFNNGFYYQLINGWTSNISKKTYVAFASILESVTIIFLLSIFLFFQNSKTFLVVFFIFLIIFYVLHKIYQKKIFNISKNTNKISINYFDQIKNLSMNNSLMKNYLLKSFIKKKLLTEKDKLLNQKKKFASIQLMPRLLIEIIFLILIGFFLIIFYESINYDIVAILPGYIYVFLRVKPQFEALSTNLNRFKNSKGEIDNAYKFLEKNFTNLNPTVNKNLEVMGFKVIFKVKFCNLNFDLSNNQRIMIEDLDLQNGNIYGLKILDNYDLKIIEDIIITQYFDEKRDIIINDKVSNIFPKIAYLDEKPLIVPGTLEENIVLNQINTEIIDYEKLNYLKEQLSLNNLDYLKNLNGQNLDLSDNLKFRINLARILYSKDCFDLFIFNEKILIDGNKPNSKIINFIRSYLRDNIVILTYNKVDISSYCNRISQIKKF